MTDRQQTQSGGKKLTWPFRPGELIKVYGNQFEWAGWPFWQVMPHL